MPRSRMNCGTPTNRHTGTRGARSAENRGRPVAADRGAPRLAALGPCGRPGRLPQGTSYGGGLSDTVRSPTTADDRRRSDLDLNRSAQHSTSTVATRAATPPSGGVPSRSSPEDGVGVFVVVAEKVLDAGAGVQGLVAVELQVPVAPVQRPEAGGRGVVQGCDREPGPLGAEVVASGAVGTRRS